MQGTVAGVAVLSLDMSLSDVREKFGVNPVQVTERLKPCFFMERRSTFTWLLMLASKEMLS